MEGKESQRSEKMNNKKYYEKKNTPGTYYVSQSLLSPVKAIRLYVEMLLPMSLCCPPAKS